MRTRRWVAAAVVLAGAGWAAGRMARAPRGSTCARYELALPYLERYYAAILAVSRVRFDAARAARLELDWWVLHREAAGLPSAELERALAALAAELYQVPAGRLEVHARRRAEAMTVRDRRAGEPGGVTDADWERIAAILRLAWRSLATEVKAPEPSG